MSHIRALTSVDFPAAASIAANAYPGFKVDSPKDLQRLAERLQAVHEEDPLSTVHGLFREGDLQGIMILYDFEMNFRQTMLPTGGVGQVAVHLAHKKEHVAKEMIQFFTGHYRDRGVPLLALYPFRPDFYRAMGFGYGTKMNRYRLDPASLPRGPSKAGVRYLDEGDKQAIVDCYHRFTARTHGMMAKTEREARRLFSYDELRLIGYEQDGHLMAYMTFVFQRTDSFNVNDILVKEFVYENRRGMFELLTFLHSQADQIRFVIIETQDDDFHYLLRDPRSHPNRIFDQVYHESNQQGVGLMYRVVDVPELVEKLAGRPISHTSQALDLGLTITDSLLPENAGSYSLRFQDGRLGFLTNGRPEVEITLDISDFSSLIMGCVDLSALHQYGLAEVSDVSYLPALDKVFGVQHKPVCISRF
jgi:predicted acetyltransferase